MARHYRDSFANPGSRHAAGRRARQVLEAARESLAQILGARPEEVVFTSGGTESINMALFGLAGLTAPGTIALTAGEHPATLESCQALARRGWKLHFLNVDAHGRLLPEQYADLPWDDLKLVTVILAHNETGVIQDLASLAGLCEARGVPLHVDAVQAVGKIPVDFHSLQATAVSLGAHKFHGPRGTGALLLRQGQRLAPLQFGGHQEAERRPGTEAVPLIAGMARALELWQADRHSRTAHVEQLRDRLEAGLRAGCPPVIVNGGGAPRLPNTLNLSFPGLDGEALLVALDLAGIGCSLGSTCASGSAEPAPALVAMGCPPEVSRSAVRFSVGLENSPAEIEEALERIIPIVARLRDASRQLFTGEE
jgi:cysteine desulfurase